MSALVKPYPCAYCNGPIVLRAPNPTYAECYGCAFDRWVATLPKAWRKRWAGADTE